MFCLRKVIALFHTDAQPGCEIIETERFTIFSNYKMHSTSTNFLYLFFIKYLFIFDNSFLTLYLLLTLVLWEES